MKYNCKRKTFADKIDFSSRIQFTKTSLLLLVIRKLLTRITKTLNIILYATSTRPTQTDSEISANNE